MLVETMAAPESFGITGRQCKAVYEVLSCGGNFTLSEIKRIMSTSGIKALETGISARIRDINRAFRMNNAPYEIVHRPQKQGSNLMVYYIVEKPKEKRKKIVAVDIFEKGKVNVG